MLVPITVLLLCNHALAYEGESLHFYEVEKAEEYFKWFVNTYKKSYKNKFEEKSRFEVFKENLKKINEKNAAEQAPVFGINVFADLTDKEFIHQYTGLLPLNETTDYDDRCKKSEKYISNVKAPESLDWRSEGVVTPVKNQQTCGSCWAFSTAANVESIYARKYGQLVDLSPQQLLDCDTSSSGCSGGFPSTALTYIVSNGGLQSESDYPYENAQSQCRHNPNNAVAKLSSCFNYRVNEETMKQVLYETGPVVVGVDAEPVQPYTGGVLKNCLCSRINHAVLLVGYGEENGVPFWVIKNSWGAQWGEQGYFRIQRGSNACCVTELGVASGVLA